ncbi:MAG: hypothetical protein DRG30_10880 [Epsilonproteobacteria bacterium]|nr:MAG: hypothetical protein DRG30_10880 [Campylobacterota bacterium]
MKVINRVLHFTTLLLFVCSFAYGENLEDRYRKMLQETPAHLPVTSTKKVDSSTIASNPLESPSQSTQGRNKTISESSNSISRSAKSIVENIKDIQSLKKTTFESTSQFTQRRNKKISELNNRVTTSAKKDLRDYSAGTVAMKSYDADKEQIALTLIWDKDLVQLLTRITKPKAASIKISRNEAKKLFSQKNTHHFYIKISYLGEKLLLSEITLFNKYQLYSNPITKNKVQSHPKKVQSPPKKVVQAEVDDSWSIWNWLAMLAWLVLIAAFVLIFVFASDPSDGIGISFIGIVVLLIAEYLIGFNWYIIFILLSIIWIVAGLVQLDDSEPKKSRKKKKKR